MACLAYRSSQVEFEGLMYSREELAAKRKALVSCMLGNKEEQPTPALTQT